MYSPSTSFGIVRVAFVAAWKSGEYAVRSRSTSHSIPAGDGSGVVSADEVKKMAATLGMEMSNEALLQLMRDADIDGSNGRERL